MILLYNLRGVWLERDSALVAKPTLYAIRVVILTTVYLFLCRLHRLRLGVDVCPAVSSICVTGVSYILLWLLPQHP